jgi:ArsR family transcriptional regulator, arsenate/arsenite/antimonite-responsive transcriptional repressor
MAHRARRQLTHGDGADQTTLPVLVDAVKALAHPGRLRLLAMLQSGDLCVCQMTAVLELAASTVSAHLSDLRHAGLVTERKSGKWVHYRLVQGGPLAELVRETLRLAAGDSRTAADAKRVASIRRVPLEDFCRTGAAALPGEPLAVVRSPGGRSSARRPR